MGGALQELNKLTRKRGQFAAQLAVEGQLRKRQRAREHTANQAGRGIPTSGPGRRRAKAHRNAGLCMEHTAEGLCREHAFTGSDRDRCLLHDGRTWIRTRGKQYETDTASADTGWQPVYA